MRSSIEIKWKVLLEVGVLEMFKWTSIASEYWNFRLKSRSWNLERFSGVSTIIIKWIRQHGLRGIGELLLDDWLC